MTRSHKQTTCFHLYQYFRKICLLYATPEFCGWAALTAQSSASSSQTSSSSSYSSAAAAAGDMPQLCGAENTTAGRLKPNNNNNNTIEWYRPLIQSRKTIRSTLCWRQIVNNLKQNLSLSRSLRIWRWCSVALFVRALDLFLIRFCVCIRIYSLSKLLTLINLFYGCFVSQIPPAIYIHMYERRWSDVCMYAFVGFFVTPL